MPLTKTVSLRVSLEDLDTLRDAGLVPSEVMREALRARARALRAAAWAERVRGRAWEVPPGSPRSEALLREDRDRR